MKTIKTTNDTTKTIAAVFRILASPIRLKMIELLSERDYCACEFPALLHISQPLSSRNLAILKQAGLITSTPNGQFNIYHLKNKEVLNLIKKAREILNITSL
jgi:ArsR family transcriptional regulator